jgi:hypothetical protein
VVAGSGTLYALERFHHGATRRAAWGLVAAWALVAWGLGGWLAPAAEPYRVARLVGERLDALAAQERAEPIMATFSPPALVYTMGRPLTVCRDRVALLAQLDRSPTIVTALIPEEADQLRVDPRLSLEFKGTVRGFNHDKLRNETVLMAVVRRNRSALASGGQQLQVK